MNLEEIDPVLIDQAIQRVTSMKRQMGREITEQPLEVLLLTAFAVALETGYELQLKEVKN